MSAQHCHVRRDGFLGGAGSAKSGALRFERKPNRRFDIREPAGLGVLRIEANRWNGQRHDGYENVEVRVRP
jgi:hypothetical protein